MTEDIHDLTVGELSRRGRTSMAGLQSGYYRTLVDGRRKDTAGKQYVRDRVLDLFLTHCTCKGDKTMNVLTLPGPKWKMEHELFRATDQMARFTAFEKDERLLHRGLVNVPRMQEGQRIGTMWSRFEEARIGYFRTSAARWFHMDLLDWCLLENDDMLNHDRPLFDAYEYWLDRFWTLDGMWLDFTAPLFTKMERALSRLPRLYGATDTDRDPVKPVIITVQKGREQKDTTSILRDLNLTRTEYIAFLLDRRPGHTFEIVEEYEYKSGDDGATMLNVMGLWKKS